MAFLNGRHFVVPQDVKSVALEVLRHRVVVTYEAEAEGISSERVIETILNALPVP
jgi:MoxR-like ATPase